MSKQALLRTTVNFGLSLLLGITLLWGGCLSCSQYFMFPASKAHCCNPAGGCDKTPGKSAPKKNCTIQAMALTPLQSEISAPAEAPTVVPLLLTVRIGGDVSGTDNPTMAFANPSAQSPPDLHLLNSVFRI